MDRISELIQYGYECDYLDFKEKQYSKDKHKDLITDNRFNSLSLLWWVSLIKKRQQTFCCLLSF